MEDRKKHSRILEFAVEMLHKKKRPLPARVIAGEFNRKYGRAYNVSASEVGIVLRIYPNIFFKVGQYPTRWGLKEWQDDISEKAEMVETGQRKRVSNGTDMNR